jgi:WD40 repeat protein
MTQCQWTYSGHRKTVLAITFLESLRLAASCDSVVHLWDPFMGSVVAQLDSARNPPITVLRAMPPPSTSLMAATNDATLRLLDARTCSFVSELKVVKICRNYSLSLYFLYGSIQVLKVLYAAMLFQLSKFIFVYPS